MDIILATENGATPAHVISQFPLGDFILLLGALIGLFLCFYGYRFVMISLGILGFIIGAFFGAFFGLTGVHLLGYPQYESLAMLLLGAVLGIAGSLGSLALLRVGLFILGLSLGVGVVVAISSLLTTAPTTLTLLAGAVAGGAMSILAKKTFIVIGTSLSGSTLAVLTLQALLTHQSLGELPATLLEWRTRVIDAIKAGSTGFPNKEEAATLIAIVVIFLGGMISQSRIPDQGGNSRSGKKSSPPHPSSN